MAGRLIFVAGRSSADTLLWKCDQNGRINIIDREGGALLLTNLLRNAAGNGFQVYGPEPLGPQNSDWHARRIIDLMQTTQDSKARFRVERLRQAYTEPGWPELWPKPMPDKLDDFKLLLLDDTGGGVQEIENKKERLRLVKLLEKSGDDQQEKLSREFAELEKMEKIQREAERALFHSLRPRWLLYMMGRPLATGYLWNQICEGPLVGETGQPDPERLVVVITADDLRAEGIELSRHLSWEKTSEDFVKQLASNGKLGTLVTCSHLIVLFGCDGVIHYQGPKKPPMLYFDPKCAEGEFLHTCPGRMIGLSTAFIAGLGFALAADPENEQCIDIGIRNGFAAARSMAETGFEIRDGGDGSPDYPLVTLTREIKHNSTLINVLIPAADINSESNWTIIDDIIGDPQEVAYKIARFGPNKTLHNVPLASFQQFVTADRKEIESFRSITNLLQEYWQGEHIKPLSIAVFGQPGCGKSFGIMQVATHAANKRQVKKLEFNLSQFTDIKDLSAAFHLIRDEALSGVMPIVLFDEFDSVFEGTRLGWLRYFLAPMQDGRFRENGYEHPLGAAIFIFIGGTSPTFAEFSKYLDLDPKHAFAPDKENARRQFVNAKGPDFLSRLRGYVDILGPSQVSEDDRMYPIRRAILLNALLNRRASHLKDEKGLKIDPAVLSALLSVPRYRHGARSLEMLLSMSSLSGLQQFDRAALPSQAQLGLHVNSTEFMDRISRPRLEDKLREKLGEALHNVYREEKKKQARAKAKSQTASHEHVKPDLATKPWECLNYTLKESSRLAADDIPYKLRQIGYYIGHEGSKKPNVTPEFSDGDIRKLAQREHERFNAERLQNKWQRGDRDVLTKTSPCLIPWEKLSEDEQTLDIVLVRCIPDILENVGRYIFQLGTGDSEPSQEI